MTPKRISTNGPGPYQITRWAEVIPEPNGGESYKDEYFAVDLEGFGSISDRLAEGVAKAEAEDRNKDFLLGVQNNGASPLADEYRKKLGPELLRAFDQVLRDAAEQRTHDADALAEPSLDDLEGNEPDPRRPRPRRRRPGGPTTR